MKKNIFFLLLAFFSLTVFSQSIKPIDVVDIISSSASKKTADGTEITLTIKLNIKKSWHINANQPLEENLIATVLKLDESPDFTVEKITYPQPELMKLSQLSENELALYIEQATITVLLKVAKNVKKETLKITGKVKYQPCNDQICLFPVEKQFEVKVMLKEIGTGIKG